MSFEREIDQWLLRSADEYHGWKFRIAVSCFPFANCDIFTYEPSGEEEWSYKCWAIVINSLHKELLARVSHVTLGDLKALLAEINIALRIHANEAEKADLKYELWNSTMANQGKGDLET